MGAIFVAYSTSLGKWGSDVGLSKHLYKLGYAPTPLKPLIAAGWAAKQDWRLIKQQEADGLDEAEMIARAATRMTMIDPKYYPRIKETTGLFKLDPVKIENHILMAKALSGAAERVAIKIKPVDFAAYLIHQAVR